MVLEGQTPMEKGTHTPLILLFPKITLIIKLELWLIWGISDCSMVLKYNSQQPAYPMMRDDKSVTAQWSATGSWEEKVLYLTSKACTYFLFLLK